MSSTLHAALALLDQVKLLLEREVEPKPEAGLQLILPVDEFVADSPTVDFAWQDPSKPDAIYDLHIYSDPERTEKVVGTDGTLFDTRGIGTATSHTFYNDPSDGGERYGILMQWPDKDFDMDKMEVRTFQYTAFDKGEQDEKPEQPEDKPNTPVVPVPKPEVKPEPTGTNSNLWTAEQKSVATPRELLASSLNDCEIGAPDTRFKTLLAEMMPLFESQVKATSDDLVITRTDVPGIDKLVVKFLMPRKTTGKVIRIKESDIPKDRGEQWLWFTNLFKNNNGADEIHFPKNAVISPYRENAPHLAIRNLKDCHVYFNGTTLDMHDLEAGAVARTCERVIFHDYTFRSSWVTAVAAKVEADESSPAGFRLVTEPEFVERMEAQYKDSTVPVRTVVKAKRGDTYRWEIDPDGTVDIFANRKDNVDRISYAGNGIFKATTKLSDKKRAPAVGSYVYIQLENNDAHTFWMNNADSDVSDIGHVNGTIYNGMGMGWGGEVERGFMQENCYSGPDPDSDISICGTISDSTHLNSNGGDVIIRNGKYLSASDDLFTAKGNNWMIVAIDGTTITVDNVGRALGEDSKKYGVMRLANKGHRMVFMDMDMNHIATATASEDSHEGTEKGAGLGKRQVFKLDKIPKGVKVGSLVANPDLAGGRIIVTGNEFARTRSQGALMQAAGWVVEDNYFHAIAGPGVKLNYELDLWYEGPVGGHGLVKDNRFKDVAIGKSKPPYAIYIRQKDAHGNDINIIGHISLTGNGFVDGNNLGSDDERLAA